MHHLWVVLQAKDAAVCVLNGHHSTLQENQSSPAILSTRLLNNSKQRGQAVWHSSIQTSCSTHPQHVNFLEKHQHRALLARTTTDLATADSLQEQAAVGPQGLSHGLPCCAAWLKDAGFEGQALQSLQPKSAANAGLEAAAD
jgi:hypothetical protein